MMASRIPSEIWSAILSGWPSVTDSEVKRDADHHQPARPQGVAHRHRRRHRGGRHLRPRRPQRPPHQAHRRVDPQARRGEGQEAARALSGLLQQTKPGSRDVARARLLRFTPVSMLGGVRTKSSRTATKVSTSGIRCAVVIDMLPAGLDLRHSYLGVSSVRQMSQNPPGAWVSCAVGSRPLDLGLTT